MRTTCIMTRITYVCEDEPLLLFIQVKAHVPTC